MSKKLVLLAILVLTLGAIGCSKNEPVSGESSTGGESTQHAAGGQRAVALTPASPNEGAEPCSLRRVYFAYDSADLDDASRQAIQNAVECMRGRGAPARLHLTGATDPRGTEEYNIALGERRADSVRRYLVSLGVDAGRIAVNSVGEEMAQGSDESGWREDRNVSSSTQ